MSAPIAAVPRRVNLRPGRRIHAFGERQHVELVTGVQRERNVERPLPPVVRFLPAKVYGNSTFPAGPVRPALCHPVHDLTFHSARASGQQPSDRRVIESAPPVRSRSIGVTLGTLFRNGRDLGGPGRSTTSAVLRLSSSTCSGSRSFQSKKDDLLESLPSRRAYECCIRYKTRMPASPSI